MSEHKALPGRAPALDPELLLECVEHFKNILAVVKLIHIDFHALQSSVHCELQLLRHRQFAMEPILQKVDSLELGLPILAATFVLLHDLGRHAGLFNVASNKLSQVFLFLLLFLEFLVNFLQLA